MLEFSPHAPLKFSTYLLQIHCVWRCRQARLCFRCSELFQWCCGMFRGQQPRWQFRISTFHGLNAHSGSGYWRGYWHWRWPQKFATPWNRPAHGGVCLNFRGRRGRRTFWKHIPLGRRSNVSIGRLGCVWSSTIILQKRRCNGSMERRLVRWLLKSGKLLKKHV